MSEQEVAVRLDGFAFAGKRLLVVIPDGTRTAPMQMLYRQLCRRLLPGCEQLDFLIALGTHPLMSEAEIDRLVGPRQPGTRVLNHRWDLPDTFVEVGKISQEETWELSEGRLRLEVPIRVNRLLLEYDRVLLLGPVFPHEVAGFSGGSKYIFPGVGGGEVIHFTHWLGALVTSFATIGVEDTAVRRTIELAAERVPCERTAICLVTSSQGLHGMFIGPPREAWRQAAALSAQVHVRYHDQPYQRVLSLVPERYQDLWTGAKGMYKVEPVVAEGGEVVLHAPHITEVSYTHGHLLDQIGYHVRDYFTKQWERFREFPWGVLAHSTHLRGCGTFEDGVEKPRVELVLATGIEPERCRRLGLGYRDPATIDPADWERPGSLLVPNAGEILHRLKSYA
ncbi:MAG: lactate racemase domain-containing protein [Vulcanimicrobiota bacterium]